MPAPGPDRGPGAGASVLDLSIPSDVAEIPGVVDAVVERCTAHRFSRQACSLNVRVALLEALANAVVKGNRQADDKRVHVRAVVDDARLVVDVQDEGEPFDLDASAQDPLTPEGLLREDGRGIFLMRRLMDAVERLPGIPRGNVVRLTLRRA
ncbi:ATP-binding protein [Roseisolibacter sp. H3M3-2]|uniref:ATP-binding protein n=1 Tax=Roseisolibacter sp. H3M3-2 TaxID=3031323 RepID=UPI0023DC8D47|nr:ATP-binding protein [Roseisolibacter sp. H3M3-2]MDF1502188.1 ATP-binding protein [Roseisolibacter sp. H3M3-2]